MLKSKAILFSFFLLTFLAFLIPSLLAEESITITTYYPSPQGSYNNLYVANSLGIGMTSPGSKLQIAGSQGVGRSIMIDNREVKFRGDGIAHFSIFGPDTGKSYLTVQNTSANSATGTVGADLFTIHSAGYVGIGTTNPLYKLHVAGTTFADFGTVGNIQFTNYNNNPTLWIHSSLANLAAQMFFRTEGPAYWTVGSDDADADKFKIATGTAFSGAKLTVNTSGYVGIGTTNPTYRLQVNDTFWLNGGNYNESFFWPGKQLSMKWLSGWGSKIVGNAASIGFMIDTTDVMSIRTNGLVGIGTTGPTGKLDIRGVIANILALNAEANTTTGQSFGFRLLGGTNTADYAVRIRNAADTADYFYIRGDGAVGIGTVSPEARFHIDGGEVRIKNGDGSYSHFNYSSGSQNYIRGNTFIADGGGNVGIGTATPGTYKCYINGTGYLNATAWVYGSDIRLKENISYIQSGLNIIEHLKPVKFDYIKGDKKQAGFIAQEVQEILPDIVTEGTDGMLGMKTDSIIPYLVKAIQEQQKEIKGQQKQVEALRQEIQQLKEK